MLDEKLVDEIHEIHGGKSSHRVDELANVISAYLRHMQGAARERAYHPFLDHAKEALESVESLIRRLDKLQGMIAAFGLVPANEGTSGTYFTNFGPFTFAFRIPIRDISGIAGDLEQYLPRLRRDIKKLERVREKAYGEIDIEVEPSFDENYYLAQGWLIVPSGNPARYHTFRLRYDISRGNPMILLEPASRRGYDSFEQARNDNWVIPPQMLGTIATAKNTENYPLMETAVPTLKRKYLERMKG